MSLRNTLSGETYRIGGISAELRLEVITDYRLLITDYYYLITDYGFLSSRAISAASRRR
jgi:hypothetical protein